jgi:hypothetical protein
MRGGQFYGFQGPLGGTSAGPAWGGVENTAANSSTGALIANGAEMNAPALRGGRRGRSRATRRKATRRKMSRRRRTMRGGASYVGSANVGHGYTGSGIAGTATHAGYAANVPGPGAGSQVNGVWQTS